MANEIIDHYKFRYLDTEEGFLLHRKGRKILNIMSRYFPDIAKKYCCLDLGCGDGTFGNLIAERFKNSRIYGCDYSMGALNKAQEKKIHVIRCNLEEGIPFESNAFDLILATEILEHLYNPDLLLEEIRRDLKKTGYLLLSTPNLCAWYNRILFLFGIQPIFMETSVKWASVGAGPLKRFKRDVCPVGHIRIFNFRALKDLLTINGFKIVVKKGGVF